MLQKYESMKTTWKNIDWHVEENFNIESIILLKKIHDPCENTLPIVEVPFPMFNYPLPSSLWGLADHKNESTLLVIFSCLFK